MAIAEQALKPAQQARPDLAIERRAGRHVAGIDEAGRGPLAGPVIAAAVMFERDGPAGILRDEIADSKQLSHAERAALAPAIRATAHVGVGLATVAEIDTINILRATHLAMRRAVVRLPRAPRVALVDGNQAPGLVCPVWTVVGGDGASLSIAAASIIAKVTRDRIMRRLAAQHPGFGWERNAGYGTAEHRAGLGRLGATPHHRRSFAPVRKVLTGVSEESLESRS